MVLICEITIPNLAHLQALHLASRTTICEGLAYTLFPQSPPYRLPLFSSSVGVRVHVHCVEWHARLVEVVVWVHITLDVDLGK